jgi:hypothetical protein
LCNENGLVEPEPYLVNGGRFGVQLWIKDKKKVFYPMPRSKEDIATMEDFVWRPKKERPFMVLTESSFLDGLCWQVRRLLLHKQLTCLNYRISSA